MLNTYSDAKNVLTGVIDQRGNLRKKAEIFWWIIAKTWRKFDSDNESAQLVTSDLVKQEVAMTIEAQFINYTPKKVSSEKLLKDHCHDKAHMRSWFTPFFVNQ